MESEEMEWQDIETAPRDGHARPSREELAAMIEKAKAAYNALTPEQKAAHDQRQRESWVRGMASTGDPRFD